MTTDALLTQREIAQTIVDSGGTICWWSRRTTGLVGYTHWPGMRMTVTATVQAKYALQVGAALRHTASDLLRRMGACNISLTGVVIQSLGSPEHRGGAS